MAQLQLRRVGARVPAAAAVRQAERMTVCWEWLVPERRSHLAQWALSKACALSVNHLLPIRAQE